MKQNRTSEDLCGISFTANKTNFYLSCEPVRRSSLIPPVVNASHLATFSLSDFRTIMTNSHRQDPISRITESAFSVPRTSLVQATPTNKGSIPLKLTASLIPRDSHVAECHCLVKRIFRSDIPKYSSVPTVFHVWV